MSDELMRSIKETAGGMNDALDKSRETVAAVGMGHAVAIAALTELLIEKGLLNREEVQARLLAGASLLTDEKDRTAARTSLSSILALVERSHQRPN